MPWEKGQAGSVGAARFIDDKWVKLDEAAGWPNKLLHVIPLLDGGTRSFVRRAGNWLVLRAGQPVLLIEQQGRRLTALPSASREDIAAAVASLPKLNAGQRNPRHRLTVDEWNNQPVTTTEGRALLESVGFVRDYQGMTLYALWS